MKGIRGERRGEEGKLTQRRKGAKTQRRRDERRGEEGTSVPSWDRLTPKGGFGVNEEHSI